MASNNDSIMIIDDEIDITVLMRLSLQKYGFNAYDFTDPFLALEHFRVNCKEYRLVISDTIPICIISLTQQSIFTSEIPKV